MSLLKRIPNPIVKRKEEVYKQTILARYFHDLEGEPDFPLNLALISYEKLQETTGSQEELFRYMAEDCIFTSLYATFYEELFAVIQQNPEYALPLVEKFSSQQEEREQIIAEQAELHMNFIESKGLCPGCACCDNHADVADLITYYQRGDIDFFTTLYIGMQTIQFSMEHILYDVIPSNPSMTDELTKHNVLQLRQYIFDYVEERI
ncbi:hypothetical protein HBN50_10145 [Halobacteriovorax sp. GB3]|uniref:hypothetical protein n=1 Tax=Halobacteriovorax sp. GB3 TaxID=2719615 RepID=UPI00236012CB|nr:hypothetical protein [Halobacteriovorax sp. GB3]MDD0853461.1 hypothetical protein [Halobacteriovorax sp. GB3]